MTQQQLAEAVGAHWITISKLERGRIKLTTEWLDNLAAPLGVYARDLLAGSRSYPTVPFGFAEGSASDYSTLHEGTDWIAGPDWTTIEGSTFEPFLHAGDEVQLMPLKDLTAQQRRRSEGRLCFFGFGTKAARLGFLYSAKKSGRYDLFWLGQRVINGAKATGLSLVAAISFRIDRT